MSLKHIGPYVLPSVPQIILVISLLICSVASAQTVRVPTFVKVDEKANRGKHALALHGQDKSSCFFPTIRCVNGSDDINKFYQTTGTYSFFNQIKSIYNGASGSATVSADIASFNLGNGMQMTAGTNIQAGSSGVTNLSTGAAPTLSQASAGQATQNMLYGGTVFVAGILPVFAYSAAPTSTGGMGVLLDMIGREGVDIQNFTSGTNVNASSPPSHSSTQMEGYLLYNSINLAPGSTDVAGSVFVGGSYGYAFTSHGYARNYGFGSKVNSQIGQVSVGIVVAGVAKIAVSRGFGPSQKYIDSTSMAQTTVNNFKAWSFGISYQSPVPK